MKGAGATATLENALSILDYGCDEGDFNEEAAAVRALVAERDLYRGALADIKTTCDGRLAGEPRRATYLGISNFIKGVLA